MTNGIVIILLGASIAFGITGILIGTFFWLQNKQYRLNAVDNHLQEPFTPPVPLTSAIAEGKPVPHVPVGQKEETIPTKLVIGSDINDPLIEIQRYDDSKDTKFEKLNLPKKSISNISAMLQQAPNLLTNSGIKSRKHLMVTFSKSGRLVQSHGAIKAVLRGQNGQIREIGNVQDWMKGAAVSVGVWQVLALITAQKFLSDINERLQKIEEGISRIKRFSENERISRLEGNYDYLRQVAETIRSGELTPVDCQTVDNQIESIERECSQIIRHIEKDITEKTTHIRSLSLNDKFTERWTKGGLQRSVQEINSTIDDHSYQTYTLHLALQVKLAAIILKGSLPVNRQILEERTSEVTTVLEETYRKTKHFLKDVDSISGNLKGTFTFGDTVNNARQQITENLTERMRTVFKTRDYLNSSVSATRERLEQARRDFEEPTTLIVSMDKKGQIEEIKRPLKS